MTNYTYNEDQAKKGSDGYANNNINTSGCYVGKFTQVKAITAKTGSIGVEFSFESGTGQKAGFITIYTHNKDGKEIGGSMQMQALMRVLKIKELGSQQATVEQFDKQANGMVKVQGEIYPQLTNQNIGVVLQREDYRKQGSGDVGFSMNLVTIFDSITQQTAKELIDKSEPKTIEKLAITVKDILLKANQPAQHQSENPAPAGFDDADPFG